METPDNTDTAKWPDYISSTEEFPPRSKLTRLIESLEQESPLLSVPIKRYQKMIRDNNCFATDEINAVISAVTEAADADDVSLDESVKMLTSVASRIKGLRQELENGRLSKDLQAKRFMSRLDHLCWASVVTYPFWKTLRMSRILVDYMLRMSYFETARELAQETDVQDYVDIEEFEEARNVISALQRKDLALALAWCADNKYELNKFESKLEFNLRLQEFVELVRCEDKLQAITYARKYLAPWGTTDLKDIQRVLATLVFHNNTQCARYKVLFEEKQWDNLVDQFKQEFYKLYGLTDMPLLYIYLQCGLCALKTPLCYKEDCNKEDPLSQESLRKLASSLPFPMPCRKAVCYITRELMGSENLPVLLPNGYIYSSRAIRHMLYWNNGKITCPRTGAVFGVKDIIQHMYYAN